MSWTSTTCNTLEVHDDRFEAHQGSAKDPIAVVEAPTRALFRLATGQARRRELEAEQQITIHGDARMARRFLDAVQGAWLAAGKNASA